MPRTRGSVPMKRTYSFGKSRRRKKAQQQQQQQQQNLYKHNGNNGNSNGNSNGNNHTSSTATPKKAGQRQMTPPPPSSREHSEERSRGLAPAYMTRMRRSRERGGSWSFNSFSKELFSADGNNSIHKRHKTSNITQQHNNKI